MAGIIFSNCKVVKKKENCLVASTGGASGDTASRLVLWIWLDPSRPSVSTRHKHCSGSQGRQHFIWLLTHNNWLFPSPPRLLTHAKRWDIVPLHELGNICGLKFHQLSRDDGRNEPRWPPCFGVPSKRITVSESPWEKTSQGIPSAIETENFKNLKTAVYLVNCTVRWKSQKPGPLKLKTSKQLKKGTGASCSFLRSPGGILNCSLYFSTFFVLEMYIDFGLPKVVLPTSAYNCLCHPLSLFFVVFFLVNFWRCWRRSEVAKTGTALKTAELLQVQQNGRILGNTVADSKCPALPAGCQDWNFKKSLRGWWLDAW